MDDLDSIDNQKGNEMNEVLDHVVRFAPVWATTFPLTECGRRTDDVGSVISFDDLVAKFKKQGKQRSAMSTCMTCLNLVSYGHETDQVAVVSNYLRRSHKFRDEVVMELEALNVLVAAHWDEYNEAIAALRSIERIGDKQ